MCQKIFLFADSRSVNTNNFIKILKISCFNQDKLFPLFRRIDDGLQELDFEIDPKVNERMENIFESISDEKFQIKFRHASTDPLIIWVQIILECTIE